MVMTRVRGPREISGAIKARIDPGLRPKSTIYSYGWDSYDLFSYGLYSYGALISNRVLGRAPFPPMCHLAAYNIYLYMPRLCATSTPGHGPMWDWGLAGRWLSCGRMCAIRGLRRRSAASVGGSRACSFHTAAATNTRLYSYGLYRYGRGDKHTVI